MYKSFFGLSESPFSISPNPKFFYLSIHHREALAQLKRGISQSGGFVLFTGEVGTGKTVIARSLLSELPGNVDRAVIFDPDLSLIEILETICREFAIDFEPNSSKRVLIEKISDFLTTNYQKGRKAILMIDEAQHLSDEVIEQVRLLTNIETDNEKLLQVILIGQPELQDILRQQHMRQIAQRITSRFHLLPLSLNELDSYVRFRMQSAGCVQIVFSQGAIGELYKASSGIPRVINVMADKALQIAFLDRSHIVEKKHMHKAVLETLGIKDSLGIIKDILKKGPSLKESFITLVVAGAFALFGVGAGYLYFETPTLERDELLTKLKEDSQLSTLTQEYKELLANSQSMQAQKREQERFTTVISNLPFESDAFKDLKTVWGFSSKYATDNEDVDLECQSIRTRGFMCVNERASLLVLENYNVPAVIKISDGKQPPFYATLLRLNSNFAQLLMQGREWVVTREWLENSMESEFRLIWPLPYGYDVINAQSPQEVQLHLSQILFNFDHDKDYVFNGWDVNLVNRIKRFQEEARLKVDGKVGTETLWALLPYTETDHPLYLQYILSPQEEEAYTLKKEREYEDELKAQEKVEENLQDTKNQEELTLDDILMDDTQNVIIDSADEEDTMHESTEEEGR